jgi:hypothetical protein
MVILIESWWQKTIAARAISKIWRFGDKSDGIWSIQQFKIIAD